MSLLTEFLEDAPAGTAATLAALACAESLTDQVARSIYEKVPVPGLAADDFVSAFKYSGLTEPRNSEWNLNQSLRQELIGTSDLNADAKISIHRYLLALGKNSKNRKQAGSVIPSYLFTEAGQAYHLAGTGDVEASLAHYSAASRESFSGAQWLGAKLAEEQERTGVIPKDQVETTFLRAWVMLREGRKQESMPLFRRVAETDRGIREVAISLHLVGNEDSRRNPTGAERGFVRSIEILRKLNNDFGVAQTLHSLANLLSRQERRFEEAEKAYRESIEIGRKLGNDFHVAQTLHSLANLLSRQERRFEEAEKAYRESIELGEKLRLDNHVAQVLRSQALLVERHSPDEALGLLQRSLDINKRRGNQRFVDLVVRTMEQVRKRAAARKDAGTSNGVIEG